LGILNAIVVPLARVVRNPKLIADWLAAAADVPPAATRLRDST
jgi:hypothetical protein